MKRALKHSMLALTLLAASSHPAPASERITLMVGGIDKIIYLPVKLAEKLGYFSDEDLDIELRSEWSGVHGVDVLLVGTGQGVAGFYDHTIFMLAQG